MKEEYLYNSNSISREINVNGQLIGGKKKIIIAGPCTFGSYNELYQIAKK